MDDDKVVFQKSQWDSGRYEVQHLVAGGYRWNREGYYSRKSSAIARAEEILRERGISDVRVVDLEAS